MLIGSISYSNIQRNYATPAYVLGILIDENDLPKLAELHTKEFFQPERTYIDPFDLSPIEEEIKKFSPLIKKEKLLAFSSDPFKPEQMTRQQIDNAYDNMIPSLTGQDLVVMSAGVKEIRLQSYFNDPTYHYDSATLNNFFQSQKYSITIEKKPQFSKIMELTRLIVWKHFLINRRFDTRLTRTVLKQKKESLSHILQLNWPSVSLNAYTNSFVGFPWITIKKSHQIRYSSLMLGTIVSFFPLAKSCTGKFDSEIEPFYCSNAKRSEYGIILSVKSNEIHCKKCSTAYDRLKFSKKTLEQLENDDEEDNPLVKYHDSLFCIYITRFNNKLKIGRALYSRGIPRLLEQAAFDALVFFPIMSLEESDNLEKDIKEYLKTKKELLGYGITVTDRIPYQDKIQVFTQWINGLIVSNSKLYLEIIKILKENPTFATMIELTENRILDLTPNWQIKKGVQFNKLNRIDSFWCWINGEIRGILGSFIIIDNNILDLRKYYGVLYRGEFV